MTFDTVLLPIGRCGGELPEHVAAAWSELPEHVTAAWSEWFVVVHVCRFTDSLCLWSRLLSVRPSLPSKGSS